MVFIVLLLPISVSAGLIGDFFSNIFGSSDQESLLTNKSVQNMALLVATDSPLVGPSYNVPVVEGSALVSSVGPSGTASDSLIHKPTSDQISIYVVREGDTLSQIAEMFDVTVNTIKWNNNLSSNTLRPGDTLVILPISGVKHAVIKGDTITSIAKKYKGDIDEIVAYNNIREGESLAAGSIIIIPDGEVLTSSSSYVAAGSSSLKEYKGYYMRPVVGGRRSQGLHGHNAIDIAAPVGTPILAMADGEIIIAKTGGWNGGYGNYIVIKHSNGTQTLYAHNSSNVVSVGDTVSQGDVIGFIGTTGKITGPHLHFEIRGAKNPF